MRNKEWTTQVAGLLGGGQDLRIPIGQWIRPDGERGNSLPSCKPFVQAATGLAIGWRKALTLLVETAKQIILGQAARIHVQNIAGLRRERHEVVVHQRRNRSAVMRGMDKGTPMNLVGHRNCDVFQGPTAL